MPSVKEIEAFMALVEAGSVQAAARRLNATPPAISKRIIELESELGVRLFDRSTRSCHITPRGRALIPYAQRVLGDLHEIQRTIGQRSSLAGHLRLGVVETIALTQLGTILQLFAAELPELTIDVEVGATTELVHKVRTRELDLACVVAPLLEGELASEPFWDVKMSWIAPARLRLPQPLSVEALAQQTILLQKGSRHVPVIEGWLKSRGVRATRMVMCNSVAIAIKMAAAGLGLSLVPIECARKELDDAEVVRLDVQVKLPANSFIITYSSGPVEPALDSAIGVMRTIAAKLRAKNGARLAIQSRRRRSQLRSTASSRS
jgi:DNA-binding transcriptional LysR family regulator